VAEPVSFDSRHNTFSIRLLDLEEEPWGHDCTKYRGTEKENSPEFPQNDILFCMRASRTL